MKAKERRKAPEITPRLLLRSYLLQDNAAAIRTRRPCDGDTCVRPSVGFTTFRRHTSLVLIYSSRKGKRDIRPNKTHANNALHISTTTPSIPISRGITPGCRAPLIDTRKRFKRLEMIKTQT
ncbi:hypothetical protein BDFB_012241 [Asbolus verrucosus]|uniref:Uncharacterized protein n=1 Tax=Asbolus verrucosus TaxID=1661398 RepID=A0A482VYG9_ASBVE|nr:hypothetical protein BDFB_012241 [Asbolus verrucosus]